MFADWSITAPDFRNWIEVHMRYRLKITFYFVNTEENIKFVI